MVSRKPTIACSPRSVYTATGSKSRREEVREAETMLHGAKDEPMTSPLFIDLFAGCGGLSLGLNDAGWRGLFGIEYRCDAFRTYRANFLDGSRAAVDWPDDWLEPRAWNIRKILKQHENRLRKLRGQVDLVCGGPPCPCS